MTDRPSTPAWLALGGAAVAYFLAHELAFLFPDSQRVLMAVWPAGGLALAALLLSPRRRWSALLAVFFVSGWAADVLAGRPALASLGYMSANVLESFGCAFWITRVGGPNPRFRNRREVLALLAAAVLVNAVTAGLGAAVADWGGSGNYWISLRTWWVADGLGLLLVAPAIVAWAPAGRAGGWSWGRAAEFGLFLALWLGLVWLVFRAPLSDANLAPRPYLLVALLAWPALRFGLRGSCLALLALAAVALPLVLHGGHDPWGHADALSCTLATQVFIAVASVGAYLLQAVYAEAQDAERRSQESFRRLAAMADHVPQAVVYRVVRGHDGRMGFDYISGQLRGVLGLDPAAVLADAALFYDRVLEEDRAMMADFRARSLGQMELHDCVIRFRRTDGGVVALRLISSPQVLPDGRVCWDGIQLDVTDSLRQERERLARMEEAAQASRMELIGRLAGGVAHDFNNRLGVILGYTDMAAQNVDHPAALRCDLAEIRRAAQSSAELTQRLLAFARRQPASPVALDLNETVRRIYRVLERMIGERITVRWSPREGLWSVRMDPAQVDQVLVALFVKARDAIADVGVVAVSTRNVQVDADFRATHLRARAGEYVVLSVEDDGAGLEPASQERVFEPFFAAQGLGLEAGLGLATVLGVVEQNGGFIRVQSAPGEGSRFDIYLPRWEGAAAAPARSPDQDPGAAPGPRAGILVVEDQAQLLRLAAKALERRGYRVLAAATPAAALEMAAGKAEGIQLLLTDVVMPGMNGRDLALLLREAHPGLRVLFMSGYSADVAVTEGPLEAGASFLQKPFVLDELLRAVERALAPA